MIDKTYQPGEVEGRIYAEWEKAGAFRAGRPERAQAAPYSIVIPPPNVTGSLHMGHALNNTLQDILARFERMRGKDVLWQPGTDHAGIATQMVVERQLMERQEPSRRDMGRQKFLERVWAWKAESGGTIVNQLKRLGASCDWSRERFTMDEGLSKAVIKVFVQLHNEGLIYKDKRLVNWDPKLLTAISDLEVQQVEIKGHLWHIKYPIEGSDEFIIVATTRPETMLGDVAVAVHPDNEKLKHLIGKNAILPLVGRRIPIVGDDYADPEKGTGAVKITPAHDFNDFEVGKRHNLPPIAIFTVEAKLFLSDNADFLMGFVDDKYGHEILGLRRGDLKVMTARAVALLREKKLDDLAVTVETLDRVDRFVARKLIVARLETMGLIEKIEPHTHIVPHGDRSGVVIEPFLTNQWYVDAKTLAEPAIRAVREDKTQFIPKNWEKTYFDWMENIQPWCISRQLWWGHQIPAWYGPGGNTFVAENEAAAVKQAEDKFKCAVTLLPPPSDWTNDDVGRIAALGVAIAKNEKLNEYVIWRDEDVLDTWFSSALWPFSTLGWPDETKELKRFYPTNALVTGFDIIFFWVARMMMMGLHFRKEVPFKDVYIHRLVRDEKGAKMSKSKGNVVDPLGIIDDLGADALRFTLARGAAQGHDIRLSPQTVENNRNFATKLWNAARFVEFNGAGRVAGFDPKGAKETLNRWIVHETAKAAREVTAAIEAYEFNSAAEAAYRFVWNVYCDWYVELSKPLLTGSDGPAKDETRATAAWAFDEILKLLHPFMPFITEELWGVMPGSPRDGLLVLSPWPELEGLNDEKAEAEIGWFIDLVTAVRSVRAEMNIPANTLLNLEMIKPSQETFERAGRWDAIGAFNRLARIGNTTSPQTASKGSIQLLVRNDTFALPLFGIIDVAAERTRLEKEMQKADSDIARVDGKLNNPKFVANAAEEVVEGEREKREEAVARREKIVEALERLKKAS